MSSPTMDRRGNWHPEIDRLYMNARWSMQKVGGSIIAVGLVLSLVWHFGFEWWVNPEPPEPYTGPGCIEMTAADLDTTATDSL